MFVAFYILFLVATLNFISPMHDPQPKPIDEININLNFGDGNLGKQDNGPSDGHRRSRGAGVGAGVGARVGVGVGAGIGPYFEAGTLAQRIAVRRVAGGTKTEVNKYPWIVLLLHFVRPLCGGGSLIADKWILTAAHCYDNYPNPDPKNFPVVIGEHDISTRAETSLTKLLSVDKIIIHPHPKLKDIALLRLSKPVDLNVYTPICLPRPGEDFTGKKAWVYGWGNTRSEQSKSNVLRDLEMTVVSDASAKQAYASEINPDGPENLTDKLLAVTVFAGGEAGKDACFGDSGGPLSYSDKNGKHTQIGIVSFGAKGRCGIAGLPGAYTEVSALRPWIDLQMRRNGGFVTIC